MAVQRRHAIGTFVLERPATLSKAIGNDSTERGKGRWDCILKAIQLWNSVGHNEGKKADRFSVEIVSFLLIRSVQSQRVCLARRYISRAGKTSGYTASLNYFARYKGSFKPASSK